jgi:omega-hydroxy-beta-dihydromenaquinone-9 sulfotransferase
LKDSYLTAGIRLGPLIRMIRRNPVSLRPKYLVRLIFLVQSSIWSTVFSRVETVKYGKALNRHPVPQDPVFIIGHWRTGSTFLHQLMARDPNLTTPTLFQVAQPESFLTAYHYYKPLFRSVVSKHRPMDMVRLGMNEPQEDEYAIFRMTRYSPLEKLIFPEPGKYFLTGVGSFLPSPDGTRDWEQKVLHFFRKIHFQTGRRIVSKNPFNSLRINQLIKLFPNARFIHIVRNPMDSVPSTIHMWSIVQRQNCLNRNRRRPLPDEVCDVMNFMMERISEQVKGLPSERYCTVRFEDLEQDPAGTLKTLYGCLGIPFTPEFEKKIGQFLEEVSGYRKNVFSLSDEDKKTIGEKMKGFMLEYGYFPYF